MYRTVTLFFIASTAAWLSGCLQNPESTNPNSLGEAVDESVKVDEAIDETVKKDGVDLPVELPSGPQRNAGAFDIGVIPDMGVNCPAGSEEIVIGMDDEDTANQSSRSGFIGKTNLGESTFATRFYFCKVNGAVFRPFSTSGNAADQRDDYAVLKLGTTCPADSQEFARGYDNEDTNNANFHIGVITPNLSNTGTTLIFCLFRFSSLGLVQPSFPNLGFRYGVFAPSDFNRGALAFGSFTSDDEDTSNISSFTAPNDALVAAKRIIEPSASFFGSTIHHVVRAR
jgi:hypothetical protein